MAIHAVGMTIHAFGPFRLDTRDGLLLRGTDPIALGRRATALLQALVERPRVLVSKDALFEAAWPGLVVDDTNLTVQIAAVRRALGEVSGGDRWIETMPGRGYRYVGPVAASEEETAAAVPPGVDPPPDAAQVVPVRSLPTRRRRRRSNGARRP